MTFCWKKLRGGKKVLSKQNSIIELAIPAHFRCPISLDLMKDPVTLSTGITYDRESIEEWIEAGNQTCPVTNQVLSGSLDRIPNHALRRMIQDWCVENRSNGVDRIPTPRVPVTSYEISETGAKIIAATQKGDEKKCRELVEKIKNWAKESERNKRVIAENGLGYVLSASFEMFSSISIEKHANLLGGILLLLTWVFPLGVEGQAKLGTTSSLRCMSWFLKGDDLSTKKSSVLALKELLTSDNQKYVNGLIEIDGVPEALLKIIKVPICPSVTKASLTTIYQMINSQSNMIIISRFLELGLVELVLEVLVDAEKSMCEAALRVLDAICSCSDQGRERAQKHALTVPMMVKKILRVSSLATDFCVSILWTLCRNEDGTIGLVEALLVGAFQKILLMLQVNCGEGTKEKATQLLKLMNRYKHKLDCFDSSMDLRYLKRSY